MTPTLAIISLVVGYLLGTIPTAYVAVKIFSGKDIRQTGSGNVGAMNSFEITGSKWTGFIVFLVDALKGIAAVLAVRLLIPEPGFDYSYEWIALFGAIAGHNFNLWLSLSTRKLAGGKGLATACGGLALVAPWLIACWGILFFVGFLVYKLVRGAGSIIPGNVTATALLPIPAYLLIGTVGLVATIAYALLIIPKHVGQMRELLAPDAGADPTSD